MTLKITFICGNIYPLLHDAPESTSMGGAEVQQFLLGQELQKLGMEVGFVTRTPTGGDEITPTGFRVYGYGAASHVAARTWSFVRALWDAGSSGEETIDYFRGFSLYGVLSRVVAGLKRRPFILAISSNRSVYPPQIAGYSLVQRQLYRLVLRTATRVVAQTHFQAKMLASHYGVNPARLVVIPNGAQDPAAQFAELPGKMSEPPTIVWLATVHQYKGIEAVLELAQRLPNLRFVIGGGPAHAQQDYYARIKAQAGTLPNVTWRGFVARHEVDGLMHGALAFLNTTVAGADLPNLEGFPNVYLEAWRNGVPVLTLHNDPDGMIKTHNLGFVCGGVKNMEADLLRLAGDRALREVMGKYAFEYFENHHRIGNVAQQYFDLFRNLRLE